jgi:hypothetical protein
LFFLFAFFFFKKSNAENKAENPQVQPNPTVSTFNNSQPTDENTNNFNTLSSFVKIFFSFSNKN